MRSVESTVKYLAPFQGKPVCYGYRQDLDNLPLEDRTIRIEDARPAAADLSLDAEGFVLTCAPTGVKNFFDQAEREVYQRESEELIRNLTGASMVVSSIGSVIRRSERSPRFCQDGSTVPGRWVHCDFSPTPNGSSFWVKKLLPAAQADVLLRQRYAFYNIWRVLSTPPQDTPIALCDVRTVSAADRIGADCVVDGPDDPGFSSELSVFRYDRNHRWLYFPNMTRDEVLVFKGYDSDANRTGGVPHVAFDDPSCPAGAPPRESIDVRMLAFFG
jgi:hypothetical protein